MLEPHELVCVGNPLAPRVVARVWRACSRDGRAKRSSPANKRESGLETPGSGQILSGYRNMQELLLYDPVGPIGIPLKGK